MINKLQKEICDHYIELGANGFRSFMLDCFFCIYNCDNMTTNTIRKKSLELWNKKEIQDYINEANRKRT